MEIFNFVERASPIMVSNAIVILLILLLAKTLPKRMRDALGAKVERIMVELAELRARMDDYEGLNRGISHRLAMLETLVATLTGAVDQIRQDTRLTLETLLKSERGRDSR